MRNARKALIAPLVLVGASMILAMYSVAPANATEVDIRIHDWNMSGHEKNGGSLQPASFLASYVSSTNPKPWLVVLNEVCWSQFQFMDCYFMEVWGYAENAFSTTRTENLTGDCGGKYGNAMWLIGTSLGDGPPHALDYAFPESMQSSAIEKRRVECRRVNSYLGPYVGCVTHLTSASAYVPDQSHEAWGVVQWNFWDNMRWVGGDFNSGDHNNDLPDWVAGYDDVGVGDTWAIPSPTQRYDYIWRDIQHPAERLVARMCGENVADWSDHCYKRGRLTFNL